MRSRASGGARLDASFVLVLGSKEPTGAFAPRTALACAICQKEKSSHGGHGVHGVIDMRFPIFSIALRR